MKKEKVDYKLIALFEMAKQKYMECDKYAKALLEHVDLDGFEDWVWEFIIEDNYTSKDVIKKVEELKKKEEKDGRTKTKKH